MSCHCTHLTRPIVTVPTPERLLPLCDDAHDLSSETVTITLLSFSVYPRAIQLIAAAHGSTSTSMAKQSCPESRQCGLIVWMVGDRALACERTFTALLEEHGGVCVGSDGEEERDDEGWCQEWSESIGRLGVGWCLSWGGGSRRVACSRQALRSSIIKRVVSGHLCNHDEAYFA
jgi:hypothetical protein